MTLIEDNVAPLMVALAILLALLLIGLVGVSRRVAALRGRVDALTQGVDGRSLEEVIGTHAGRTVAVSAEVDRLVERTATLERGGRKAFQRIGLVRFNPFEDTGGNQSFALALLDADDDGIVVSSLHARGGTRIYAKAVVGGRPEASLSDEETEAVRLARGAAAGRVALAERGTARPQAG